MSGRERVKRVVQHASVSALWVSLWFALPFVALNRTIGR